MTIVEIIKQHAEAIVSVINPDTIDPIGNPTGDHFTFNFSHSEPHEENFKDSKTWPFVFLEAPLSATKQVSFSGLIYTTYALRIMVGTKSRMEKHQEQRQELVDKMEQAVNELISRLFSDDSIEIIGEPWTSEFFNDMDLNSDGWYLNIKVKKLEEVACPS